MMPTTRHQQPQHRHHDGPDNPTIAITTTNTVESGMVPVTMNHHHIREQQHQQQQQKKVIPEVVDLVDVDADYVETIMDRKELRRGQKRRRDSAPSSTVTGTTSTTILSPPLPAAVAAVARAAAAQQQLLSSDDDDEEDEDHRLRRRGKRQKCNSSSRGGVAAAEHDPALDVKPAARVTNTTTTTATIQDNDDDEVQIIDVDQNTLQSIDMHPQGERKTWDQVRFFPSRVRRAQQQQQHPQFQYYADVQEVGPDGRILPPPSLETAVAAAPRPYTPPPVPKSALMQVLEIFPDVDVTHLKGMLSEFQDSVELVVSVLSEKDYPKDKSITTPTFTSAAVIQRSSMKNHHRPEPKYDYSSVTSSSSFQPSSEYLKEAVQRLIYDFPFMKVQAIRQHFKQQNRRYTLTRQHIQDLIVGKKTTTSTSAVVAASAATATSPRSSNNYTIRTKQKEDEEDEEERQFHLVRAVVERKRVAGTFHDRLGRGNCKLKWSPNSKSNSSSSSPPEISDDVLKDEIYHFELQLQLWTDKVEHRIKRNAVRMICQEKGTLLECGICYDTFPISEMISCRDHEHLFCTDCTVSLVETAVFSNGTLGTNKVTKRPAHEILCCHESGCQSGFRDSMLQAILPEKTWEKYSEMQANASIELAGLEDTLGTCPKCGYQAFLPETEMIFACPVEDCRFASCRKCGEPPHIPLRCEEAAERKRQERQDTGRLKVEEALSDAKIRVCPKCKKKSIKSDGCNKITCPCGMKFCYICRAPLDKEGYAHFCNTPHCDHTRCGKCKLHSNNQEDDDLAMKEAGITALERYKAEIQQQKVLEKEKARGGASSATTSTNFDNDPVVDDVHIDLNQILHDPSRPRQQTIDDPTRNLVVQHQDQHRDLQQLEQRRRLEQQRMRARPAAHLERLQRHLDQLRLQQQQQQARVHQLEQMPQTQPKEQRRLQEARRRLQIQDQQVERLEWLRRHL